MGKCCAFGILVGRRLIRRSCSALPCRKQAVQARCFVFFDAGESQASIGLACRVINWDTVKPETKTYLRYKSEVVTAASFARLGTPSGVFASCLQILRQAPERRVHPSDAQVHDDVRRGRRRAGRAVRRDAAAAHQLAHQTVRQGAARDSGVGRGWAWLRLK